LAAEQSLTEDKTARQVVDQSLRAFEEAKASLAHDLQSAQASLTATTEKLIFKSSALNFVLIQERETELKLQAAEEKIKAQEQLLASTQKRSQSESSHLRQ
jgi:predicted  nucleic acid-binding Zn-ribbon protein